MELKSHDMTVINLEDLPTRQKIIQVTINLIAQEGIHGLTTRNIAAAAKVNVAAVNYYFGSKEKLIEESLQSTLNHMFTDTIEILKNKSGDPSELLKNIMFYFLEGCIHYPGIIKAVLHEPINNNNYETSAMQQITDLINKIILQMEQFSVPQQSPVKTDVMQMISSILMTALLPDLFRKILGDNFLTDYEIQQKYIESFFK